MPLSGPPWPTEGMDWTADSKADYLITSDANGSSMLTKVATSGARQQLLGPDHVAFFTYAIASPDGHYAALSVYTGENNVWMIENF